MRRRAAIATLLIICLVLLGLPSLPARLLPRFVSGDQVLLSGLSGTLWRGKAARAVMQTPMGYLHLGELRWQLSPLSLLVAAPALELSTAWGTQRGELSARLRGDTLEINALDFAVDASIIKQVLPVDLDGRVQLLFENLVLQNGLLVEADGRAVWQDASWLAPAGRRPLGTYAATFESAVSSSEGDAGESSGVRLKIETLSGMVRAEGDGELGSSSYELDVRIEGDNLEADVAQALALVAAPEDNGYRLRLSGAMQHATQQ